MYITFDSQTAHIVILELIVACQKFSSSSGGQGLEKVLENSGVDTLEEV